MEALGGKIVRILIGYFLEIKEEKVNDLNHLFLQTNRVR